MRSFLNRLNGWQRIWLLASAAWLIYTIPPLVNHVLMQVDRYATWQLPLPKAGKDAGYRVIQGDDGERSTVWLSRADLSSTNLGEVAVSADEQNRILGKEDFNRNTHSWSVSEEVAASLLRPWTGIDTALWIAIAVIRWLIPPFLFYAVAWLLVRIGFKLVIGVGGWIYDGFKK